MFLNSFTKFTSALLKNVWNVPWSFCETVDTQLLTAVRQYSALPGAAEHTHTMGGRGWRWDVSKVPLICRKPPFHLPDSAWNHPPFIPMMHTHTQPKPHLSIWKIPTQFLLFSSFFISRQNWWWFLQTAAILQLTAGLRITGIMSSRSIVRAVILF